MNIDRHNIDESDIIVFDFLSQVATIFNSSFQPATIRFRIAFGSPQNLIICFAMRGELNSSTYISVSVCLDQQ